MSWMSQLYKTYENNIVNEMQDGIDMTPMAHMNANAQLEITLSQEGEFRGAISVEKNEAVTLIPVTEASAGRTSGIEPHALSDTLSFLAGDFTEYCKTAKQKKSTEDKFARYIENLEKWVNSQYSHPSVVSIYIYLKKKCLISDLVRSGIVHLMADGTFDNKKISGQPYEKALVRFRVLHCQNGCDITWKDHSLIQCYTNYYLEHQQGRKDICYFSGKEQTVSENHPKGIVAANYGAKLMSANDSQGFTYRGRFQNAEQSCAVSYEASQKIHSALTWLAKLQGIEVGKKTKRTFICWNPEGKKVPDIFDELGLSDEDDVAQTDTSYRKKVQRILKGYRESFEAQDTVVMIALDAATIGRLSVTYYQELGALDFFERVTWWSESCRWYFLKFNTKNLPYFNIETPVFQKIVECAVGRERAGVITVDDKVMKEQVQRLVKCMLERQPMPFDIVQALAIRASCPLAYSRKNREKVLSTACAVISKYYLDKNGKGEQADMKLDENNRERSYLFGRLLAVCEKVERSTYDRKETREPNAIRLQSAYVNHPLQTWKILEEALSPYFQKLSPQLRKYYRDMIGKIAESFKAEDEPKLNQALKETYLIGYYLQRAELNKKKEGQKNEQIAE